MTLIYESPDGGRTVYSRDTDRPAEERTQIFQSEAQKYVKWIAWRDILDAAEDNPTLADAISKVETIYALVKKETY